MRALVVFCSVASLAACTRDANSQAQSQPTTLATVSTQSNQTIVAPVGPEPTAVPTPRPTARPGAQRSVAGRPTAHVVAVTRPTLPPVPRANAPVPAASPPGADAEAPAAAGGPKIYSVATNPSVVHNGEAVTWDVRTSADVVSVTAHVSAYTLPLQQRGPGKFFLAFTIPSTVPSVFHGTYNLELTARAQNGASAKRDVPMIFE